jgi:hypothetical protein
MPAQHKLHHASTANTNLASIGAFHDKHCKMETHSLPPTQFILKFQPVSQRVRHHVELVVMPADNRSRHQASGQASNSFHLAKYVHVTLLLASLAPTPTLWRLLQTHSGVPMAMVRNAQRAHLLQPDRLPPWPSTAMGMQRQAPIRFCMAAQPNGLKRLRLRLHVRAAQMVWQCMSVGSCRAPVLNKTMSTVAVPVACLVSYAAADKCAGLCVTSPRIPCEYPHIQVAVACS